MFVCEKNYTCCDHKYWDTWENVEQEAKECGHLIEVAPVVHGKLEECDRVDIDKAMKFLEGFAFNDDQRVYTNGTLLVPLFRVKQAFVDKAYNGFWEG